MFLSGLICPLGFSGGFADALLAATFAGVLTFLRLYLAASNQRFGDIFEWAVFLTRSGRNLAQQISFV